MKYVVKMFEEYWLRVCEDHMEELYDLEKATVFNTKKAAKNAINDFNMVEYCEILKLEEELPKFLEWKAGGMIRRSLPKLNKSYSRPYNGEGLEDVIDWHLYLKEHEDEISYTDYKTWPDVHEFLDNFYKTESYWEGDYGKLVHSFKLMVSKEANYSKFKKELNKLTPYVSYKEDDYLIFSIFDHELSEYESRYFHYKSDKDCKIMDDRGNTKLKGTLKECFNKIKQYYYYE